MNVILASFLPQSDSELRSLSQENQELMKQLVSTKEDNIDKLELLEKNQSIIKQITHSSANYIELDEYETNIYVYFTKYITSLTNIKSLETIMWNSFIDQKEVNIISNAIREVTQRIGSQDILDNFLSFTCVDLEFDVVKDVLLNVIDFFTNANNNREVMGVLMVY